MQIVIIGWGSLIWDPRTLPREGTWQSGGPNLPIEFSRVSRDCRLTLVIDYDNGRSVQTKYVLSPRVDLADAVEDLRVREDTSKNRIGFVDLKHNSDSHRICADHRKACDDIASWLKGTDFDAAVWTALPSNFKDETNQDFCVEKALQYLEKLPESAKQRAFKYIKNAPKEIKTPLRQKLLEIGWINE